MVYEMPDHVFISYAHEDNDLAQEIAVALYRSRLAAPYIDKIALGPGDSLTEKLGEGLDKAMALVVILSRDSIGSPWVKKELKTIQDRRIPIFPVRRDDSEWPTQIRLLLGDPVCIDAVGDLRRAIGSIPKLFTVTPARESRVQFGEYFSLRGCERRAPHFQFFQGTIQSFWDEHRFGRSAVVLPTNESINLRGRVTSSFLSHIGIRADDLSPSPSRITSSQVAELRCASPVPDGMVLLASTVFNERFAPEARDQWNAAVAVLDAAEALNCTLVIVPPLGTGTFDWPVRQAVVNWMYGAMRWASRNPMLTELSVWPVLCVPGPGDQAVLEGYLRLLSGSRREILMHRQWTLKVRHEGTETDELPVADDLLIGAVAKNAIRSLDRNSVRSFRHGKGLFKKSTKQPFEYEPSTPLARTIFADGDTIEVISASK
jgi:hypothetical protein